jgi:N-acetyl-gamma-glutamyl-phosphate reductase
MKKIHATIIGAAGFVGGELIRVLSQHPQVSELTLQSNSQAGKPVAEVHRDLFDLDLTFQLEANKGADVIFISKGHGQSKDFLGKNQTGSETLVIDMSRDFRLMDGSHDFVYALPEWNREKIKSSKRLANCGCFATAIQLALLPLAKAGKLNDDIHIQGMTGSTGAGFEKLDTTHFSWRNNNISLYKAFTHQHLDEVNQLIQSLQPGFDKDVNFIPMRGNFTRGILVSAYVKSDLSLKEVQNLYEEMYNGEPFVHISEMPIDMKQVVNTNNCLLQIEKYENKILVTSAIDNLLKGAAGQAVQNMNIHFGFEETAGLKLKPIAF